MIQRCDHLRATGVLEDGGPATVAACCLGIVLMVKRRSLTVTCMPAQGEAAGMHTAATAHGGQTPCALIQLLHLARKVSCTATCYYTCAQHQVISLTLTLKLGWRVSWCAVHARQAMCGKPRTSRPGRCICCGSSPWFYPLRTIAAIQERVCRQRQQLPSF